MTNTPALLPPDPDRPGRYWVQLPANWIKPEIWEWSPQWRRWHHGIDGSLSAADFAALGYTFASPHPIPSAAALERLHKLADDFKREAREGSEGVQADYRLIAICTAQADADMLRAALEDKG